MPYSWFEGKKKKMNIVKMTILQCKLQIQYNPYQNSNTFFIELEQII